MKIWKKAAALLICTAILCAGCSNGKSQKNEDKEKNILDPQNPTSIMIWNYYNGAQQEAFNKLVSEFNETKGKKLGIVVETSSEGSVTDLENSVLDSVNHKVGASDIPNIFAAYVDTAYAVDKLGLVADLTTYLSEKEQEEYIDSYIKEGRFSGDGELKIFPIAKSTEIFMINKTDWDKFAKATGADIKDCETLEGITSTAKAYYEWTDSLTDTPDDGKAFFGRDAIANYFIVGAKQLGVELFSVKDGKETLNFDKEVLRKLWDNYYVPYVNGYFDASGRFRSDDVKTGNVISFIGSSSGATFFPEEVIINDEKSYPIEMVAMEAPQFKDSKGYAVQQGAGMVVTKKSKEEIYASVEFLKWFTDEARNIEFSVSSGYLPVKKEANNKDTILDAMKDNEEMRSTEMDEILEASVNTIQNNELYTTPAFEKGTQARSILENSMSDKAKADRKTVTENIKKGMSREKALAPFISDENFNKWYDKTKEELASLIKK